MRTALDKREMAEDNLYFVIQQQTTIREQIYKRISELIFTGRIRSRERIVEAKLAEHLGVSRTPVREALHLLENEGVLESIPRVGYQMREIRSEEIQEIFELRKINETLAVRWTVAKITPEEIDSIERCLAESEELIQSGNLDRFTQKDAEFHELLIKGSGSVRLSEICRLLRKHLSLYRVQSLQDSIEAKKAQEDHRSIFDRVKARDEAGAVKAVIDHIENVRRHTVELIGCRMTK
jgi:DNA-binding GntR family transcriptional regulator